MKLFETKDFFKVSELIEKPSDYFDFPSSLIAFAESLRYSYLWIYEGVFFRRRGNYLTLITFICEPERLDKVMVDLFQLGYKIKCLNFVNKNFEGLQIKKYMLEYYVESSYNLEYVLSQKKNSKSRYKIKRNMNKGCSRFHMSYDVKKKDVFNVFDSWVIGANKRHFMVMKGHYRTYIKNHFEKPNNTYILGFYDQDKLYGYCGYEIFNNMAQITLMKHMFNDNCFFFPIYFWISSIENIFVKHNVQKIFCGSTADQLKQTLCFDSQQSFKIVI